MSWAQCSACEIEFRTDGDFFKHRAGVHDYTFLEGMRMNPPREDGRRCLDPEELEAMGMVRDERGWLGMPKRKMTAADKARASANRA